jgi:hypothetical protein
MGTASARILDLIDAPFSWRRRYQIIPIITWPKRDFKLLREPPAILILNRSSFAEGLLTEAERARTGHRSPKVS